MHTHLGDLGFVLLLAFLQVPKVMPGAVKVHHLPVPLGNASLNQRQPHQQLQQLMFQSQVDTLSKLL